MSRYIVVAFIVALTTSYMRDVSSCGQVLFRVVIVVGPVAVGPAFIGVRRCALTEDAFEWNLKCMRSVSRYIVFAFIVALTTSYIRVVHSCGQVLFRSVVVFGPVAVGQARLSSEFAFHQFMKTRVVF